MDKLNQVIADNYDRITFDQFDELFIAELESHGINFDDFTDFHMCGGIEGLRRNIDRPDDLAIIQALLPPMNDQFNRTWDAMTKKCRMAFKKKYHPLLTHNRSPLPLESAEILLKANDEGRFSMVRDVIDIVKVDDHFEPVLIDGSHYNTEYDQVINATGLDIFMRNIEEVNPLLAQLVDKRYLVLSEYGGIDVIPGSMRVISPRYGTLENMHGHGVLVSGVQYRNNSTMMIQKTAHRLMKNLYKD